VAGLHAETLEVLQEVYQPLTLSVPGAVVIIRAVRLLTILLFLCV
jgi:hypothetical protein